MEREEVNNREEFEERWKEDYPDEYNWYSLIAVESFEKNGNMRFRAISFGNTQIISAEMNSNRSEEFHFSYYRTHLFVHSIMISQNYRRCCL